MTCHNGIELKVIIHIGNVSGETKPGSAVNNPITSSLYAGLFGVTNLFRVVHSVCAYKQGIRGASCTRIVMVTLHKPGEPTHVPWTAGYRVASSLGTSS